MVKVGWMGWPQERWLYPEQWRKDSQDTCETRYISTFALRWEQTSTAQQPLDLVSLRGKHFVFSTGTVLLSCHWRTVPKAWLEFQSSIKNIRNEMLLMLRRKSKRNGSNTSVLVPGLDATVIYTSTILFNDEHLRDTPGPQTWQIHLVVIHFD